MKAVFVTGANGFVGSVLCRRLAAENWTVFGSVRTRANSLLGGAVKRVCIRNADGAADWRGALQGIDTVVHLAARVHELKGAFTHSLEAFREVNVNGTARLARQAAEQGVSRFIFMSSVKVNGEENRTAYTEFDTPSPKDAYAISKAEAEAKLHAVAAETGLDVVVLRPPLVYGPGVRANFLRLLRVVDRKIPLPLASTNNQRSLIYVENLVDALLVCIRTPAAAGQTYLVSDGEDVSTPELIRMIAAALHKPPRLFRFPPFLLHAAGKLCGQGPVVERLIGSLTVDTRKIKNDLGWTVPTSLREGLGKTALWYKGIAHSHSSTHG